MDLYFKLQKSLLSETVLADAIKAFIACFGVIT